MVTAIRAMGEVYGADIWLGFFLACTGLYLLLFGLIRKNRTKRGFLKVLIGLLVSEVICDVTWMAAFFPGGEYCNYGLGGSYALLLSWPVLLGIAGFCVTLANRRADH